jgi:hypothetical protein
VPGFLILAELQTCLHKQMILGLSITLGVSMPLGDTFTRPLTAAVPTKNIFWFAINSL